MRVIFIGSGNFAGKVLGAIADSEHELPALVTGETRGSNDVELPTKTRLQGKTETTTILNIGPLPDTNALTILADLDADIAVAAGEMPTITEQLLNALPDNVLYVHPSPLPNWRGPNPIPYPILDGEDKTAVSIIEMTQDLYEGPIYAQTEVAIDKQTAGELEQELGVRGGELLLETLPNLSDIQPQPQGELLPYMKYAHPFSEEDQQIDFNCEVQDIIWKIRAMAPFPGAFFDYQGERIRILEAMPYDEDFPDVPSGTLTDYTIIASEGSIMPTILKRDGHEAKSLEQFIGSFPIWPGDNVQDPRFND